MIEKNYAGLDGFIWWMGVVESRNDPLEMGRCKVRVHGWHSPSLGDIPSDDLPWAVPVNSLNNSSFATAKEGDFVFGFFADGRNAQVPLILGIVPAFAIEKGSADIGFNDLRDEAALAAAPKKVTARSYSRSGGGSKVTEESPETYPKERDLNNPSVTALARNKVNETHVVTSRTERGPIAIPSSDKQQYITPAPSYNPVYPYNQAMETESGHSLEFDDTPGAERVELAHRTGTMFEIQPNGTKVEEIVKDNYTIVMADEYVYVMGKAIVSVDKDCTIKVAGNLKIDVGGDFELKVAGESKMSAGKDFKVSSSDDVKVDAKKKTSMSGGTEVSVSSEGTASLSGSSSTRVSSSGSMAISGSSTSITSDSTIKASEMSVSGKISASGDVSSSSGSGFSIPALPALPALPTGIEDFAPLIPETSEILAQVNEAMAQVEAAVGDLTALTDVQSLLGKLDVAQLDTLLETATSFDVGNIVSSLGGEFGVTSLIDGISPLGLSSMVGGLNPLSADMFTDKLLSNVGLPGADGLVSQFVDKLPVGKIKDFTNNLSSGKINQLVAQASSVDVDKLFKGMVGDKVRDVVTSLAPPQLKSVMSSLEGANVQKVFDSLSEQGLADLKNKIGSELEKKLTDKINQTVGYPIIT
jgi:hypothetical protein